MNGTAIIVYVYAGLLLVGGFVGFFKSASKASLVSGILFGLALWECGNRVDDGDGRGLVAALALAGVLSMLMAYRFSRNRKFMPSGLVALLSLGVAAWLALVLRGW